MFKFDDEAIRDIEKFDSNTRKKIKKFFETGSKRFSKGNSTLHEINELLLMSSGGRGKVYTVRVTTFIRAILLKPNNETEYYVLGIGEHDDINTILNRLPKYID